MIAAAPLRCKTGNFTFSSSRMGIIFQYISNAHNQSWMMLKSFVPSYRLNVIEFKIPEPREISGVELARGVEFRLRPLSSIVFCFALVSLLSGLSISSSECVTLKWTFLLVDSSPLRAYSF